MCLFCGTDALRLAGAVSRPPPPSPSDIASGNADVILHGGRIVTMDDHLPEAPAMAIRNGHVQALGTLDDLKSRRGRLTRLIDLDGATVMPGLIAVRRPRRPRDFIEWQELDPATVNYDTALSEPMFGAPAHLRLASGSALVEGRLAAQKLALSWRDVPLLCLDVSGDAFVNAAMARRLGFANEARVVTADDLDRCLDASAPAITPSVAQLAAALSRDISEAAAQGVTCLVDLHFGQIAGSLEAEAACGVLGGARKIRLLVAGDAATVGGEGPDAVAETSNGTLDIAFRRLAFGSLHDVDLDRIGAVDRSGRPIVVAIDGVDNAASALGALATRLSARFSDDRLIAVAADRQGGVMLLAPGSDVPIHLTDGVAVGPAAPDPVAHVEASRALAALLGLDGGFGRIAVGLRADLVIQDRASMLPGVATWIDGCPSVAP